MPSDQATNVLDTYMSFACLFGLHMVSHEGFLSFFPFSGGILHLRLHPRPAACQKALGSEGYFLWANHPQEEFVQTLSWQISGHF